MKSLTGLGRKDVPDFVISSVCSRVLNHSSTICCSDTAYYGAGRGKQPPVVRFYWEGVRTGSVNWICFPSPMSERRRESTALSEVIKLVESEWPGRPSIHHSTRSFAMLSLWDALKAPLTRTPIDTAYILLPLVCYLSLAILAIIPQTRSARIASWPIFALLALRAAASRGHVTWQP